MVLVKRSSSQLSNRSREFYISYKTLYSVERSIFLVLHSAIFCLFQSSKKVQGGGGVRYSCNRFMKRERASTQLICIADTRTKQSQTEEGIPLNSLLILNLTIRIQAVPRIPQYDLILIKKTFTYLNVYFLKWKLTLLSVSSDS